MRRVAVAAERGVAQRALRVVVEHKVALEVARNAEAEGEVEVAVDAGYIAGARACPHILVPTRPAVAVA